MDKTLRQEQAGFRKGRGTTEQIFVLRNIIEQALEWNSGLYLCFIDFQKAFDSIHRETLWKIMKAYRIPSKLINITQAMYRDSKCAVIGESGLSPWFDVESGVKQGCTMSGFLFLLVIDWIMKDTTKNKNTGIRWKLTQKLEDLDYADDLALISSTKDHLQTKINTLMETANTTGLLINADKTKSMRLNARHHHNLKLGEKEIDDVEKFTYLGAIVSTSGGADTDINARIRQAWGAFNKLAPVWRSNQYSTRTKTRIYKSNVLAVLLYGCETWRMTRCDENKLDVFLHKGLRRIFKIYWPTVIPNADLRKRANVDSISVQVKRRRWRWIGHVLRMNKSEHARTALTWKPEGRRKRGRPKETWRRTVERERSQLGWHSWTEAEHRANNRLSWRKLINGPILHEERRN